MLPLLRGATIDSVLSIQNGLMKNDQLAEVFGRERSFPVAPAHALCRRPWIRSGAGTVGARGRRAGRQAGRALEVEETLGHALRLAQQSGLSLPRLSTFYPLVAAMDRIERRA